MIAEHCLAGRNLLKRERDNTPRLSRGIKVSKGLMTLEFISVMYVLLYGDRECDTSKVD
jgi:hypothetical protein